MPKTRQGHELLTWIIEEDCGVLTISPSCVNHDYANGDTEGEQLTFHNEMDAIVQLAHLTNQLRRREYDKKPDICDPKLGGCGKPLPYDKDEDWTCPSCQTINMGS